MKCSCAATTPAPNKTGPPGSTPSHSDFARRQRDHLNVALPEWAKLARLRAIDLRENWTINSRDRTHTRVGKLRFIDWKRKSVFEIVLQDAYAMRRILHPSFVFQGIHCCTVAYKYEANEPTALGRNEAHTSDIVARSALEHGIAGK